VRCWSQNCNLVWNTLRQGSKCNHTWQFWHLNLIQVNTKPHFALWTFKSFPGLSFAEHTHHNVFVWHFEATDHYFALWASWWKGWSSPWGGLRLKHPSTHVILWIRGAQGRDCLLSFYCLSESVSSFHCHFQVPCFSLKVFSEISCTWTTTDRDLYSKQYMPARVWCLQQTVSCPVYSGIIMPYHSSVLNCIWSNWKNCLLSNPNCMNSDRDCFLSTECVFVGLTGQHSLEVSSS
jgi:hypothetical protein